MRLTKGAGVSELLGLEAHFQKRKLYPRTPSTLPTAKEELLSYLKANHFPYFIDESNQ